jgi:DNA mismatch repair ATPase MutS
MFTTDAQTIADLGVFGKGAQDSVYRLYNVTRTRGGAQVLEELFNNPLNSADKINIRSGIIQYFAEHAISFSFEPELFDSIEQYLIERDERTRLTTGQQNLGQKISSLVSTDASFKNIRNGVGAAIVLLQELQSFVNNAAVIGCLAYAGERQAIQDLLSHDAFVSILKQPNNNKLPQEQLSAFDNILRFSHYRELSKLLQHIYYLDVYIMAGKVGREKGFTFPKAINSSTCLLSINGFYHPLLKNAVPNDLEITPAGNVIFLTGANMAGKSTLMKSFGINMYLAHMGFPLAAKDLSFSVMDGIYTTINLPDNLGMGISHFYAEVLRLKKIAKELSHSKKLLVIFDELFRGTNVKDAYEGTIAVTRAFARKHSSVFVLSTHITEAGEVIKKDCQNVVFKYLPTHMNETKPVYTYKLEPGITDDRHGMIIINNERILEILKEGKVKLL